VCGPQECCCEKMWNPKWHLYVSLGFSTKFTWIVIIKIFAFSLPLQPFFGWEGSTNSHELSLLKFLPLAYYHSHFLAATLDFTSFFTTAFLGASHFLHLGCFIFQQQLHYTWHPNLTFVFQLLYWRWLFIF